ncbi:MAG: zinc-binding dehydrogenase [Chlamydiales bacterium]|nr:zinc-binding dehydrogenase [Chlamydiales bacterium]
MYTRAAILVETKKPLVVDKIKIPDLKPGQVLVKIKYSGVCHTQLLEAGGHRGEDPFLPHCLGHEGSGIVADIGKDVNKVKKGDHVILSWIKGSGANVPGTVYEWNGKKVNAGAITTFSDYAVISENRLTVIPEDFSLKKAALLGCAAPTGLGTIFNTAKPTPGESLAVFGCGGIGLCAIQGASIAGCVPIIAVDINEQKLEMAKKMGAQYIINAKNEDPVEAIKGICTLDYAIEASGSPVAMRQAVQCVRPQGGLAVIIGNAHHGTELSLDPKEFNMGKRILGTWGGDNNPDVHYPRYCNLAHHGRLDLENLTTKTYSLDQIDQALEDLKQGKVLRPLIEM